MAANRQQTSSKIWCITDNVKGVELLPDKRYDYLKTAGTKYMIYQLEKGDNGNLHYQGYIIFFSARTLPQMKKLFPGAHCEIRRGTHEQARDYCEKEDTRQAGPWEYGDEPQTKGKRNDMAAFKKALEEGKSELEIAEDDETFAPWARYNKVIERFKRLKSAKSRKWMTKTLVLWGPSGTGKTKYANEVDGNAYWVKKPGNNQNVNFDGYDGQETVIIDEFYGWLPYDLLCRMCDRYPLMVDTKGGMTNFYPKTIIITSNQEPSKWYKNGLGALTRRFRDDRPYGGTDNGLIYETPLPWNGVVKCCKVPLVFAEGGKPQWDFYHNNCTFDTCISDVPVAPSDEEDGPVQYMEQPDQSDLPLFPWPVISLSGANKGTFNANMDYEYNF